MKSLLHRVTLVAVALTVIFTNTPAALADSGLSVEARLEVAERCFRTAELADSGSPTRESFYRKAEQLAEQVVRQDPDCAQAHFILFAARGRRVLDGGRPSVASLWQYADLNAHLTRALELDPGNAAALAAKGGILLDLPSFLGGDRTVGQNLLERALKLNPTGLGTRVTLARALLEEGQREPARRHLLLAAHYACLKREAAPLMEAEHLLRKLDSGAL